MGIYDDQQPSQPEQQQEQQTRQYQQPTPPPKRNKSKGKFGYFLSALIGVIVGALLVWLIVPNNLNNDTAGSSTTTTQISKSDPVKVSTDISTATTEAVDKVDDAVVGVVNLQKSQQDLWGSFGNGGSQGGQTSTQESTTEEAGTGSGVIYKKDGDKAYIVTNNHVVDGADELEVKLADGTKVSAKLVGTDIWTDLAVISISSKDVKTVATFGDSSALKKGESVMAIGNPLGLDYYGSVTTGVVSGLDRSVPVDLNSDGTADWNAEVLQTDAAINPGNSGGALVNLAGQVIGINSMKISDSQESVEGIGFAIPSDTVVPIIKQLEQNGKVERPSLGVTLADLADVPNYYQQSQLNLSTDVTEGVVITSVESGTAASKAGLEKYDVIVELDGKKVEDSIGLRKVLYNDKKVGDTLKIKAYRNGEIINKTVTLTSTLTNEN